MQCTVLYKETCIQYTVYCIQVSLYSIQYIEYCILYYNVYCIRNPVYSILQMYTELLKKYTVYCKVCSIQFIGLFLQYNVQGGSRQVLGLNLPQKSQFSIQFSRGRLPPPPCIRNLVYLYIFKAMVFMVFKAISVHTISFINIYF